MDRASLIGDEYVSQVRTFGALGYTPHRICSLLGLRGKEKIALTIRLALPGDVYNDAYRNGCALGEYNIDAELAKKPKPAMSPPSKLSKRGKRKNSKRP